MLKWDCQHPNNTNLHSPFQLSPSHFSLFGSSVLSISAMWLTGVVGGGGCHGNQIPIRGPHAAKRDPEKEQPTLVTMATHLLGAHRRLVLSPRRWSPLCDWTSLTCSGYPFSFSSSPSLPASVCPSLCVSVFTCVWVRVISRTRKAELPSSLWHVTVKSP